MKYVSINPMHGTVNSATECADTYGAQTIKEVIAQLQDIISNNEDITEDTPIFWKNDYYIWDDGLYGDICVEVGDEVK